MDKYTINDNVVLNEKKQIVCECSSHSRAILICRLLNENDKPKVKIDKEIEILKHSLGLDRRKDHYRNHFCTSKGSDDYEHCESLLQKGFMCKRKDPFNEMGESYLYNVTDKGKQFLKELK